jgi:flagellar operon protein
VSVELNPALLSAGLRPAGPAAQPQSPAAPGGARPGASPSTSGPSFADVLQDATSAPAAGASASTGPAATATASTNPTAPSSAPLRFSKHAIERAQRRGIPLDATTLGRLQEGVGRIAGRGSRDSLVLVDGNAFVVSVPNRTVITAVGSEHMREHVFTNIDSAVIA